MAQKVDWIELERRAKGMTHESLAFAIKDCLAAVEALGEGPQFGKDANYYRDEASVYRREVARRGEAAKKTGRALRARIASARGL